MTEDNPTSCDNHSSGGRAPSDPQHPDSYDVSSMEVHVSAEEQELDSALTPSKSPGKKKKKEHIKRPMNAFMVWSVKQRKQLSKEQPKMHNTELSKRLGQMWKDLNDDEKKRYKEEAQTLKSEHKKMYPDYKYRPKPRHRKIEKVKLTRGPSPYQTCSLQNGTGLNPAEDCSSTSSDSPRMTIAGEGDFYPVGPAGQQISPVSSTPSSYWDPCVGYSMCADSSTSVYPMTHNGSPYQSHRPYSPWKPQPPSPVDYTHQPPPPPYHNTHSSPTYHESTFNSKTASDTTDYFSSGPYPPNRDVSPGVYPPNRDITMVQDDYCSLNSSFSNGTYDFDTTQATAVGSIHDFADQVSSSDSIVCNSYLLSNHSTHETPVSKTLGLSLTSPPTPPISPQMVSQARSFQPTLSSYCYNASPQPSSRMYTGYC
nr:SoxF [Halisarca dujardinii]